MGRSQNRFMKQLREKKRLKKRKDKEERKKERQENATGGSLDEMIAYVDEFGNITSKSPEEREAIAAGKKDEAAGRRADAAGKNNEEAISGDNTSGKKDEEAGNDQKSSQAGWGYKL